TQLLRVLALGRLADRGGTLEVIAQDLDRGRRAARRGRERHHERRGQVCGQAPAAITRRHLRCTRGGCAAARSAAAARSSATVDRCRTAWSWTPRRAPR